MRAFHPTGLGGDAVYGIAQGVHEVLVVVHFSMHQQQVRGGGVLPGAVEDGFADVADSLPPVALRGNIDAAVTCGAPQHGAETGGGHQIVGVFDAAVVYEAADQFAGQQFAGNLVIHAGNHLQTRRGKAGFAQQGGETLRNQHGVGRRFVENYVAHDPGRGNAAHGFRKRVNAAGRHRDNPEGAGDGAVQQAFLYGAVLVELAAVDGVGYFLVCLGQGESGIAHQQGNELGAALFEQTSGLQQVNAALFESGHARCGGGHGRINHVVHRVEIGGCVAVILRAGSGKRAGNAFERRLYFASIHHKGNLIQTAFNFLFGRAVQGVYAGAVGYAVQAGEGI